MAALTYSAHEASKALGISEWLVRREVKAGRLPHLYIGRRLVIPRASVKQWITDQAALTPPEAAS